jgi:hypothetical protein
MSDGTNPRALLVDDEAAITSKLAPFLKRAGSATDAVAGDDSASRAWRSFDPGHLVRMHKPRDTPTSFRHERSRR